MNTIIKKLLFLIAVFFTINANAQNYLISFTGTGASNIISTVKVENLTAGTSLLLNGDDILHLTGTVGIPLIKNEQTLELKIYPNPMINYSTLEIYPPITGDAIITIYEITGKQVFKDQSYLENCKQEFRISGINSGLYLINIKGRTFQYSGKLFCIGKSNETINIENVSNNIQSTDRKKSEMDYKGAKGTVDMLYTNGDRLKFTGTSGNYSTVITDVPASDKIITFNFIACTDVDGNNYPVVQIDAQVWMVENLKTTKYKDGEQIPSVSDNTAWSNLTSPGYCWYNNDEATYKDTYGALYNWYTVNTGNLCPTGWHVPSNEDWATFITFLGGETVAGGKLKETGNTHWNIPNIEATDDYGFKALPGGEHDYSGLFFEIGTEGFWWSATETYVEHAWNLSLHTDNGEMNMNSYIKRHGFSVRCLKN